MAIFTINSTGGVTGTDLTHTAVGSGTNQGRSTFMVYNDSDSAVTGDITISSVGSTSITIQVHGGNTPSGHTTATDSTYVFPALGTAAARIHTVKVPANSGLVFTCINSSTTARDVTVDASTFTTAHGTSASLNHNIFAATV